MIGRPREIQRLAGEACAEVRSCRIGIHTVSDAYFQGDPLVNGVVGQRRRHAAGNGGQDKSARAGEAAVFDERIDAA